jgi:hypothetical protein
MLRELSVTTIPSPRNAFAPACLFLFITKGKIFLFRSKKTKGHMEIAGIKGIRQTAARRLAADHQK